MARARRRPDESERLADRVRALGTAADLCEGRVPAEAVEDARRVVRQTDSRLAMSGDATVVALAGATGSGKSSLFNAITGTDLAAVGVRRPTTARPVAGTFGTEAADELLNWLDVPRRHGLSTNGDGREGDGREGDGREGDGRDGERRSGVGRDGAERGRERRDGAELDGLVLLDLPDHDSTEVAHRLEVDRLVQLVDVLVWVVDPQKYADAALHDNYLKPLAQHAEAMLVVLNQADRLSPAERTQCVADLRRLLVADGLGTVDVLAVSATTGAGLAGLRQTLAHTVATKKAAVRRLAADVVRSATDLVTASGSAQTVPISKASTQRLTSALATAAGVEVVTEAVGNAWRLRGATATGWPALSWLARFRPDPLRRLHLDRLGTGGRAKEIDPTDVGRTAVPKASGVQRARVESAVRELADTTASGLTRGWSAAVRAAARSHDAQLADRLDRAVAAADLDLARRRRWWQAVRVLQWVLVAAVVAGLAWLTSAFVLAYLQLPPLPDVLWWGLPAPAVLVIGGVLAGLLVAGLSRIGVEVGARRRVRQARRTLLGSVHAVSGELVVAPVNAELDRYTRARSALEQARAS